MFQILIFQLYCEFFDGALPVLTNLNFSLQKTDSIIHLLYGKLFATTKIVLSRFAHQKLLNHLRKGNTQKQPSRGVLTKSFSENMQQIYRRTSKPKCDFNDIAFHKIVLWHGCSPVNLLYIFRRPLYKNTYGA